MTRYAMVIDLTRCIGCTACIAACKMKNGLPKGVQWNNMVYDEQGTYPNVRRLLMPKACQQCADPPCVKVCPTGASHKRADGIVLVDYSKCIGCKYCIAVCPYDARQFIPGLQPYYQSGLTPLELTWQAQHQTGVVEKCTFCADKIDAGVAQGLKPGVDRDATPSCVITCPTSARIFGDLDDPKSAVSAFVNNRHAIPILPELGTNPSTFYIPPSRPASKGVF